MTDRFKDVLNTLGQLQAWADVGIQRAPSGKTVIDVNWAGIFIREYLTESEQLRKERDEYKQKYELTLAGCKNTDIKDN